MARSSLFTRARSRLGILLGPPARVRRILSSTRKLPASALRPPGQPTSVEQRLAELSEESRTVFLLIWREGFKQHEVAACLNISRRRVRRVLLRAIAHIAAGTVIDAEPIGDADARPDDTPAGTETERPLRS